ncbi:MAG: DUF1464 family protein [Ktedonobacteraceae bacterium]
MVLNIGVDCSADGWKTCLMDHGGLLKLSTFTDAPAMLAYVQHICALYPEPTIAIASDLNTSFAALHTLTEQQCNEMTLYRDNQPESKRVKEILIAIGSMNLRSYSIPAVAYLESIPAYRKLNRADMGSAGSLCAITTILARMREREAAWSEMRFLYLEVGHITKSIVVIEDGFIINGIGTQEQIYRGNWLNMQRNDAPVEEAFWEGLTQDLAGLMAIHHFEDIVVREQSASAEDIRRKDAVIERLGEHYQLYTFPAHESKEEGYDIAIGAALIAEGLANDGPVAEVIERLRMREAAKYGLHTVPGAERAPLHARPPADA